MSNLNKLSKANTEGMTSRRANPIIAKPDKEVVSETVRIYKSSHDMVREIAFKERKKIVEVIQEAIEMLYESKKYHE